MLFGAIPVFIFYFEGIFVFFLFENLILFHWLTQQYNINFRKVYYYIVSTMKTIIIITIIIVIIIIIELTRKDLNLSGTRILR